MALSAPGIGSGLDIRGIVSQLVDLEKRPLQQLQVKSSSLQTKVSAFGQLRSQLSNLQEQLARLANPSTWSNLALSSSNPAVAGTLAAGAAPGRFTVEVNQLARAQAAASTPVPANTSLGSGTLSIQLGQWGLANTDNDVDTPDVFRFSPASGAGSIPVEILATDDLTAIASKINAAGAGVSAAVVTDASGQRLAIRSVETGTSQTFRIQVSNLGTGSNLSALAYDPAGLEADITGGPAYPTGYTGLTLTQSARNTLATINGLALESTDNRFNGVVPGLNLAVSAETAGPVTVNVAEDRNAIRTAINAVMESYNALSNALREMTKFDPATKQAGSLQGDSTAVGLQNGIRRIFSGAGPEGTPFRRLSDVGLEFQLDGTLKLDQGKLNQALDKFDDLKTFFTTAGPQGAEGMGVRLRDFAQGMVDSAGPLSTRNQALQRDIARLTKEQDRLNERIQRVEARLLSQYSRLDGQLAGLNALSAYVTQQVTAWNNQKSN